jgi:glycosyltransferase involved in cell wall biosynthesis
LDGIKIIRRGSLVFGVQIEAFKWYLFEQHDKFDLVIDQFHGIPFFSPLYVRQKKLGFIHEVTKDIWKLNPWPRPLNFIPAFIGFFFEPFVFKKLYKNINFMTVSDSTKQDLSVWGINPKKIHVIHNGINRKNIKIWSKEKTKTITFLGALAKDKGVEEALEIFKILNDKSPQKLNFWVVGRGDVKYEKKLKENAKKLGLKNIKFWGFVDEKLKFRLLSKSHLLLNTSVREGWGLVVIEAALVGTPTVAFNVPGLRDSIINNKTGLLCTDKNEIANKIISLFRSERKYNLMKKNALKWASNFSWEKSGDKSFNLINNIVKHMDNS